MINRILIIFLLIFSVGICQILKLDDSISKKGIISEIKYSQGIINNGVLDGSFIKYYENGKKEQESIWDNGIIVTVINFDENENVID